MTDLKRDGITDAEAEWWANRLVEAMPDEKREELMDRD